MIDKIIPLWFKGKLQQATWFLVLFLILGLWSSDGLNNYFQSVELPAETILTKSILTLLLLRIPRKVDSQYTA